MKLGSIRQHSLFLFYVHSNLCNKELGQSRIKPILDILLFDTIAIWAEFNCNKNSGQSWMPSKICALFLHGRPNSIPFSKEFSSAEYLTSSDGHIFALRGMHRMQMLGGGNIVLAHATEQLKKKTRQGSLIIVGRLTKFWRAYLSWEYCSIEVDITLENPQNNYKAESHARLKLYYVKIVIIIMSV